MSTRQPRSIAIVLSILLILSFILILKRSAQAVEAPIIVNSSADVGSGGCDANECTLREAIVLANTRPGEDTINFSIPGSGVHTIRPLSALPEIVESVLIDGYTQTGARPNTNPTSLGVNTVLMIELDGTLAGGNGFTLRGGTTTLRGVVVNRFPGYAVIATAYANPVGKLEGNFFGVDSTGKINMGGGAIMAEPSSSVMMGDLSPAARNLIVGSIGAVVGQVSLRGNLIGTDNSGLIALGQSDIFIGKGGLTAGGTVPEARNVILGRIFVDRSRPLEIQGNYIGVDVNGQRVLGQGGSIEATGNGGYQIINNVIKGSATNGVTFNYSSSSVIASNTIEAHAGAGIWLDDINQIDVYHNTIAKNRGAGIVVTRAGESMAALRSNLVYHNGGLGIDLGNNGVSANDPGDSDYGPNQLQNYPELTRVELGGNNTVLVGRLNSKANAYYRIEVFYGPTCDESGYGEGETPITVTDVRTDGNGMTEFGIKMSVLPAGYYLSTTATDSQGNTSEFSKCIRVPPAQTIITIVKETQPKSMQDFSYYGPFGKFFLDDAVPDDGDSIPNSVTYIVNPGTYNFAEGVFQAWYLADIACVGSGQSTKDMLNRSVAITVNAGQQMTCTFVTQRRVNLQAIKFNDLNGDSLFTFNEPTLFGWEMVLYNSQNMRLLGKVTDSSGSTVFNNRIPGTYKLCETPKVGWSNTLPGAIDASLARPCYNLTLQPGQSASVLFGNTQGSVVRPLEEVDLTSGVTISDLADINEPEGETPVDIDMEQKNFLPLISR